MIRIDVIAQTQKQVVLKVQGELADDDVGLLAGELWVPCTFARK